MNKGLRLCSGDIVGILNSDDIYLSRHALSIVNSYFFKKKLIFYLEVFLNIS